MVMPISTSSEATSSLTFAIIVGEHSGDTLGAGLMKSLQAKHADATFIGIGGPKMIQLGFQSLFAMEELSVMGVFEVLGRLRRLLHIRKTVVKHFISTQPDVFIGIDAPDFNLPIEEMLKKSGIKTVQYVSPSVWAWREKRIFKIARATDMVLSLLPFEKDFYDKYKVPCTFVGHSLADDIPLESDKNTARKTLNLPLENKILALMPGSRGGELNRLVEPFLQSAELLAQSDPSLIFVAPMVSELRAEQFKTLQSKIAPSLNVRIISGKTQEVMAASDCLLMASGTVALEAALIKRPMVITYKVNALTYHMFKGFIKLKWFSLPNLLSNKSLVPELLQGQVTANNIVPLVKERLYEAQDDLHSAFMDIHIALKQNASEKAANAVLSVIEEG